ncbi:MAG: hypothetical protein RSA22_14770 [Acinetobacter sp.]
MKLRRDSDGNIGVSEENVINFANHYLNIIEKINTGKELSDDEKLHVMLLLHKSAHDMLKNPKKYLNKKPRGRTNQFTGDKVKKYINTLLAVGTAKTLFEAREKTADHFKMDFDTVERNSRSMDIDKYINPNK